MDVAKEWLGLIAVAISVGTFFWNHLTSGGAKALKEVGAVNSRLAVVETEIQSIKGELKHMPDSQDVVELKLAMTEMRGSMNVQAEVMSSVARTVQRLEGYLLEKGK